MTKKAEPDRTKGTVEEFQAFSALAGALLSVSKDEVAEVEKDRRKTGGARKAPSGKPSAS